MEGIEGKSDQKVLFSYPWEEMERTKAHATILTYNYEMLHIVEL